MYVYICCAKYWLYQLLNQTKNTHAGKPGGHQVCILFFSFFLFFFFFSLLKLCLLAPPVMIVCVCVCVWLCVCVCRLGWSGTKTINI